MKHTTMTQLADTSFSTANYTLVYTGSFPNTAGAGWMEVTLDNAFTYNGTENLMVLAVKGYQPLLPNTPVAPRWLYTNISPDPDRARRYYGNLPFDATTQLTTINYSSNIRLDFGSVGVLEIRNDQFIIFPNPGSDVIKISVPSSEKYSVIKIYDQQARLILQRKIEANQEIATEIIDMGNNADGIYMVLIENGESVLKRKLIIQ